MVIFLLVFIAISSLGLLFLDINFKNNKKIEIIKEPQILEFSTFTSDVCENKEDFVYCKDEVFVNCNGKISKMAETKECNGFKLDFPSAVGFAVFEKDWKDRRG